VCRVLMKAFFVLCRLCVTLPIARFVVRALYSSSQVMAAFYVVAMCVLFLLMAAFSVHVACVSFLLVVGDTCCLIRFFGDDTKCRCSFMWKIATRARSLCSMTLKFLFCLFDFEIRYSVYLR